MKLDTGLVVVIVAVLIFYLRLIIIQRERAKQIDHARKSLATKKGKTPEPTPPPRYSILTSNYRNLAIAGAGTLGILAGVLLNAGILAIPAIQPFWWIPTSIGIIGLSWAFQL